MNYTFRVLHLDVINRSNELESNKGAQLLQTLVRLLLRKYKDDGKQCWEERKVPAVVVVFDFILVRLEQQMRLAVTQTMGMKPTMMLKQTSTLLT